MDDELAGRLLEHRITRYHDGSSYPGDDVVAREEPLEIRLNGITLVYLMRLPGDDKLLAAGFLLSEGLLSERGQIETLSHCMDGDLATPSGEGAPSAGPGNLVEVRAKVTDDTRLAGPRVVRTGCGGADLASEIDLEAVKVESDAVFSPEVVVRMPGALLEGQDIFRLTGGTHGAGVFDSEGNILVVKEDVGRHNAVDKALGYLLMSGRERSDKGLILSGRLSYEMVLKAARAGLPLVCSVSAPTALGIEVGTLTGVTMVGFLRGGGFNVYSHPGRLGGS